MYYLDKERKNISLLSIGTLGTVVTLNEEEPSLNRGIYKWGLPVIELTTSAGQALHELWVKKILGEHYLVVDDVLENDQADYISLDNASDGALKTLKNRGTDKAQYLSDEKQFKEFMNHKVTKPGFYEKGELIK
jgi:hypothetical protein